MEREEEEEEDEWREPRYGAKEIQREERRAGRGEVGRGGREKGEERRKERRATTKKKRRCTSVGFEMR